jgi:predicted enzyme related to lactoylglutathione lyase
MPKLFNVVFDCADAYRLASFWSAVMQKPLDEEIKPGAEETWIELDEGPNLYFAQVPEPKTVKNRVHVCLAPDTSRDLDMERIINLGGRLVDDQRLPDGRGWVVLADPEGNEFCVLRSEAERAAARAAAAASPTA